MDNTATYSGNKLKWIERLSGLLDNQFKFPGTNFRFGIDPLLNLIPFAGNLPGTIMSAVLLLTMAKHGASRKIVILMTINVLIDAAVGSIPLIGQLFDFYFKANAKNVRLLKEHYQEGKHTGSGKGVIALIVLVLIILFTLIGWGIAELFKYLF